jgi:hypothetical protein
MFYKNKPATVKRIKRAALALTIVFLLAVAAAAGPQYVASVEREPFHVSSCRRASAL